MTDDRIVGPRETLARLQAGASIARLGDGECKLIQGTALKFQPYSDAIRDELLHVLRDDNGAALTGVFHRHKARGLTQIEQRNNVWSDRLLALGSPTKTYYSTLVTRPDTLPGFGETPEYFDAMAALWRGKRVTLIANGQRSLTPQLLLDEGAEGVDFVDCPGTDAYGEIDALEARARAKPNHTVIICAGPAATCLAERLARRGRQALDLGHVGVFWRKYAWIPEWHARFAENCVDRTGNIVPNP
jgi:hypothetical protein